MRRFLYFFVALSLGYVTTSCKNQSYQRPVPTQGREQSLDAAQSDYIENLPGLGLAQSSDRLGTSAWSNEKFKVSASCRDTFQLTIEGTTIRNITNFQTFEGCVTLARFIDNMEVPSKDGTAENQTGGLRVTSSCKDDFFNLRISEGNVHINSDYLLPNADACIELRNRINSLKL